MSKQSAKKTSNQLTLFLVDSPAKTYPWQDYVKEWLANDHPSGTNTFALLQKFNQAGLLSKMSPDLSPAGHLLSPRKTQYNLEPSIQEKKLKNGQTQYTVTASWKKQTTSESSLLAWKNTAITGHGGFLTLKTPEYLNAAAEFLLSHVLETPQQWLQNNPEKTINDWHQYITKYYLTPKAALGILRRAKKRGKPLPPQLHQALHQTAHPSSNPSATKTTPLSKPTPLGTFNQNESTPTKPPSPPSPAATAVADNANPTSSPPVKPHSANTPKTTPPQP